MKIAVVSYSYNNVRLSVVVRFVWTSTDLAQVDYNVSDSCQVSHAIFTVLSSYAVASGVSYFML